MASEVEIANLALAHLGDDATVASITPPEGSAQAEHCATFYPIARDVLLESHPWKFATRRERLAALSADTWNWTYAYAEPNNVIRMLGVLPTSAASDADTQPYEMESLSTGATIILTDQEGATARFITRVTDTSKFSPLVVDALSRLLASYLAGPLLKGDAGAAMAKSQYQEYLVALSMAKVADASQRMVQPEHTPTWIGGR